jgi:tetratricopeptide (TPR) repeat protein
MIKKTVMNFSIRFLWLLIIFSSSLCTSYTITHVNFDKKLAVIEHLAEIFLIMLQEEDYQVISNQRSLFTHYEKLLACIVKLPEENLESHTATCFAKALSKGANIYRRIANEISLERARHYHQKALSIRKKHLDYYALEIAHSLIDLGATYNESKGTENNTKAIQCYNEGLIIYEKNHADQFTASTLHKLGNAYRDLDENNVNLAIDYLNRALQIYEMFPENEFIQREKAKVFFNQGVNYHHCGTKAALEKAIDYLHEAKKLFELDNDNARYAMALSYLGDLYRCLGNENSKIAIECLDQALCRQKELFGDEHFEIAVTLFTLGIVYHDLGGDENLTIAIHYFENALAMQRKLLRENHQHLARTLYYLGLSYIKTNMIESGVFLIEKAFAIFKTLPSNHYYIKMASESFEQLYVLLAPYT